MQIPNNTPELTGAFLVEEVGSDVKDLKVGDRVCVQPTIWDGDCRACVKNLVNCCDKNGFVGLSGWGGGMSEHIVLPETAVKKIPDNVSLELGALVEPLAVGWHAVEISPFKEGDSVLVLGGGPIGLSVVQVLKGKGCENIIVSEVSGRRREFATQFGAHHTINPTEVDVVEEVARLTGGKGADVGFDAAGVQVGLDGALKAIRARGTLVNIAVWEKRATLSMNDLVFRERVYMAVGMGNDVLWRFDADGDLATYSLGDFEAVIQAISEGMSLQNLVESLSR